MDLTILEIAHHRNGISGAPFAVVRFQDNSIPNCNMVGIVFEKDYHVAVFDAGLLGKGEIRFMYNSWRGDWYEKALRDAIKEEE